jgi:8-oxo-dGTP diphosphatase
MQRDSYLWYGRGVTASADESGPDGYDPSAFPPFAVTVDVVVLTVRDRDLHVLLIERDQPPFRHSLALPGGFVQPDESLEQAALRELREETSVDAADHLEQLGSYGDPGRDPRMRVVTVAYLAVMRRVPTIEAGSDAAAARLVPVSDALGDETQLAFDHRQILTDAVEAVREKLEHTTLATAFVGPEFTLSELRSVYEAGWDTDLDPANFRRKIMANEGLAEPTGETKPPGPEGGKPAALYQSSTAAMPRHLAALSSPLRSPQRTPKRRRPKRKADDDK